MNVRACMRERVRGEYAANPLREIVQRTDGAVGALGRSSRCQTHQNFGLCATGERDGRQLTRARDGRSRNLRKLGRAVLKQRGSHALSANDALTGADVALPHGSPSCVDASFVPSSIGDK